MIRLITISIVAAVLSASLLVSASIDLNIATGLEGQHRIGLFATGVTTPSVFATDYEMIPWLKSSFNTSRMSLKTEYRLRLSTKFANMWERQLLYFHQANINNTIALSRTLDWNAQANLRVGRVDYSRALLLFDVETNTNANPTDSSEFGLLGAGIMAGLTKRMSRRERLAITAQYNANRWYWHQQEMDVSFQDSASLQTAYALMITRLDQVEISFESGVMANSPGSDYIPIQSTAQWQHILSRTSRINLRGGAMVAYQTDITGSDQDVKTDSRSHWIPIVRLSYEKEFRLRHQIDMTSSLTGGVNEYYDPIGTALIQQWFLGTTGSISFPSKLVLRAQIYVQTVTSPDQAGAVDRSANFLDDYPTMSRIDIVLIYPLLKYFRCQLGIQSNVRSTHLWDPPVRSAGEEFLFYIALGAHYDILD
ncbi:MAG: hypothetical protein GY847_36520 [Proteobacteria bacterium]|nr:hypothetical protein [Pseudomonadota bacterium]